MQGIDIHRDKNILGHRQGIQNAACQSSESHRGGPTKRDLETIVGLGFFERGGNSGAAALSFLESVMAENSTRSSIVPRSVIMAILPKGG